MMMHACIHAAEWRTESGARRTDGARRSGNGTRSTTERSTEHDGAENGAKWSETSDDTPTTLGTFT